MENSKNALEEFITKDIDKFDNKGFNKVVNAVGKTVHQSTAKHVMLLWGTSPVTQERINLAEDYRQEHFGEQKTDLFFVDENMDYWTQALGKIANVYRF